MLPAPKIFMVGEIMGTSLGIFLNFTLIVIIMKTSPKKFCSYANLFMISAVFDMLFSMIELSTLHQLIFKDGVMFVIPHGIERLLPSWALPLTMVPHCFVTTHGTYILAAQYHCRYMIVKNRKNISLWKMLKSMSVTSIAALSTSIGAGFAAYASIHRGAEHYIKQLDDEWYEHNGRNLYLYAIDFQDIGGKYYICGGLTYSIICLASTVYFAISSLNQVNVCSTIILTTKTKNLQAQFTRGLLAQTFNSLIFASLPTLLLTISVFFHLELKITGYIVMISFAWLPAINSATTLFLIKDYRQFVLRTLRRGFRIYNNAEELPTNSSKAAPTSQFQKEQPMNNDRAMNYKF